MARTPIVTAMLLPLLIVPLTAGENEIDLRFEVDEGGDATYQLFSYTRTSTDGRFLFQSWLLGVPPSDYEELSAGAGYRVARLGEIRTYLFGQLATTNGGEFFQPGLYIYDEEGWLTGSLFVLYYVPLADQSDRLWLVAPIEIECAVSRSVAIGVRATYWRAEGEPSTSKVGPKLRISGKWGATEFRISKVNNPDEYQLQFGRTFDF
jgi:hypothetical protein